MTTNHTGPLLAERDGVRVIDCLRCSFAHADPLPSTRELEAYYTSLFWAPGGKGSGWLARYEAQREWSDMRDGDLLHILGQHTLSRTLLDIGAGYGMFAAQAQAGGWSVTAMEPSHEAADYLQAHTGLVPLRYVVEDTRAFTLPRYDAITAFFLLEHLPSPAAFLRWCRARLYTGGALLLALPQEFTSEMMDANKTAKVKGWWVHPTHCNYFTAATLYGLLGRCGFRVVDALATFPMARFIAAGEDYTADEECGARLHAFVRADELLLTRDERLAVGRDRARMAVGRDLVVCAVPE